MKFSTKSRCLNEILLTSEMAYQLHIKEMKRLGMDKAMFKRCFREILHTISEHMVRNKAGVYLRQIGYFTVVCEPFARKSNFYKGKDKMASDYNDHSCNRQFHPTFITEGFNNSKVFDFWTMDRRFSRKITRPWAQKLKKGDLPIVRYKEVRKLEQAANEKVVKE